MIRTDFIEYIKMYSTLVLQMHLFAYTNQLDVFKSNLFFDKRFHNKF